MNAAFWRGRRVLVTGHTGFKGTWLSLWLTRLGAEVAGFALAPDTEPSMFRVLGLAERMDSVIGDVRDSHAVAAVMARVQPEIVIHMAAQPLVRYSYSHPVETYMTNVMGTVHVLEAVRNTASVRAVVNVTTDKCYENREWLWGYRETDAMGGYDPYSSSKGCAELVTSAYRNSYCQQAGIALASARAGNVIGGGDWSADRLIPDLIRAFGAGKVVEIRSPHSTRPWQHVLEPLSGYLALAEALAGDGGKDFASGWNFGPADSDARPVGQVVEMIRQRWSAGPAEWRDVSGGNHPHEANLLKLDCSKARALLGWQGAWSLEDALDATVEWYCGHLAGADMERLTLAQIDRYEARRRDLAATLAGTVAPRRHTTPEFAEI